MLNLEFKIRYTVSAVNLESWFQKKDYALFHMLRSALQQNKANKDKDKDKDEIPTLYEIVIMQIPCVITIFFVSSAQSRYR